LPTPTASLRHSMANVTDLRVDLARRLRRELGGDFVVVATPDHPLVMRSVDVLVGGRSGLTAFVTASAEERRRPNMLGARLTLNQVALPPETQFVYVARADADGPLVEGRFAEQLTYADRAMMRDAVAFVERSTRKPQSAFSDKTRQLSQSRFAATFRVARLVNPERSRRSAENPDLRRGANIEFDTVGPVRSGFAKRPLSTRSIVGLSVSGADRWFHASADQPMPTGEPAGVVLTPGFPHPRHDPEKALRAAAFAGWILAPAAPGRSIDELADLALRFTRPR